MTFRDQARDAFRGKAACEYDTSLFEAIEDYLDELEDRASHEPSFAIEAELTMTALVRFGLWQAQNSRVLS